MSVLLATASVHTTAAACDYLTGTAGEVVVLTVTGEPAGRDAGDAANVARTRLPDATVRAVTRDGEPATVIRAVADEVGADEIVMGNRHGDPAAAGEAPGETVRAVLASATRPVVVVPV